jgi:hypothetical protein
MIIYNEKYYSLNKLKQRKPKRDAINTYLTSDNLLIGMFQGSKGQFPEIDFIVRVLKPGKDEIPFPPEHNLWVVDLMMKIFDYREEVRDLVKYYLQFYENAIPFNSANERIGYQLQTIEYIKNNFSKINQENTLSIEYVAIMIELFCINEKRNNGAYMFKNILETLLKYIDNKVDYITVMRSTKAGFR